MTWHMGAARERQQTREANSLKGPLPVGHRAHATLPSATSALQIEKQMGRENKSGTFVSVPTLPRATGSAGKCPREKQKHGKTNKKIPVLHRCRHRWTHKQASDKHTQATVLSLLPFSSLTATTAQAKSSRDATTFSDKEKEKKKKIKTEQERERARNETPQMTRLKNVKRESQLR